MAAYLAMPILVAEDDRTTVHIIRNLLGQIGFKDVDDVPDGSAALVKMKEKRYELVIADWNMAPMTGYELLKQVRAEPGFASTRFILITIEAKPEHVVAAKKAGVNNYIVKPFTAETLKLKIEAAFLA
jgi:two-component system, chemotaxis family, chemotaxis protein CheY